MDWKMKKSWSSLSPALGRRSFLKIGAAASACLMTERWSSGDEMRFGTSRSILRQGERDWVSSICLLCASACAIRVYSEAGQIVAVGGDPDDPNTGGKMCPVGLSILNLHYNPDRLTGAFRKNASGKMAAAKAEEVLALIAGRIRQGGELHIYGRITPFTSMLSKAFNAVCHLDPISDGMSVYPPFLNTEGRPPIYDFVNARIALLFDSNLLEHGYPYVGYVRRISEARLRGLRIVTLSPFLTNTATAGDWIPLRSREAKSLASLAIARQALSDKSLRISLPPPEIAGLLRSLDEAFLEKATGLSHEAIEELSRRFFNEPGPALSDLPDPSVLLLNIMKGNLNRPGGLFHPGRRTLSVDGCFGDISQILRDRRNVVLLHQSNPAFSRASEIRPILRSSSRAVVVCIDSFMSETAELSDLVLPLASPLETLTVAEPLPLGSPFMSAAPPAAKPLSSCRSFDDWLALLATAIKGAAPALSPERFAIETVLGASSKKLANDRAIYPLNAARRPLEANMQSIVSSLKTLIDLVPKARHAPLQPDQYFLTVFEESIQGPATAPCKWLNEITCSPKIYLHPKRAGRLGIGNGDSVTLISGNGASIEGIALLFEGIHPDALAIPLHHGHSGYGRVARGEPFSDSVDPDMTRLFWAKNHGVNPADIFENEPIAKILRKRG
jgi:anaerobic selenocysteine-containing dehydrogenase